MRDVSRRLVLLVGAVIWLGIAPLMATEPGAQKLDGSVRMQTTAIAPGQGITWADGQLRFQYHIFRFVLSTKTHADPSVSSPPLLGSR
jgi:hypothetical protein